MDSRLTTGDRSLPIAPDSAYDWRWMLKAIISRPLIVLPFPVLCVLAAMLVVLLRTDVYTASTTLNVTNVRLSIIRDDAVYTESQFDPTFLETQIQIISSDSVIADVARTADGNSAGEAAQKGLDAAVLERIRRPLSVARVGLSNLVNIDYSDVDPARAAEIANAVARSYLSKLDRDRSDAAEAGSGWLRDRLQEAGPKAKIVSEALPPLYKSNMRGLFIIVAAGAVGLAMGFGAAIAAAFFDRRVRSAEQVQQVTGRPCFGLVPRTGGTASLREVVDKPFSPLWYALRYASVLIGAGTDARGGRLLGVTSVSGGEGKSTAAANLALMNAGAGKRVLLVDAQPYDMSLSTALAPSARVGLVDLLGTESVDLASRITTDPTTGLSFLPLGTGQAPEKAAQMLWSPAMERLLPSFRHYDLVVFDLPPMLAVGDVHAAASMLDGTLLVVEWGETTEEDIESGLRMAPAVREKLVGTLVNKSDEKGMQKVLSPFFSLLTRQRSLVGGGGKKPAPSLKSVG